jgi:hypothetical protein
MKTIIVSWNPNITFKLENATVLYNKSLLPKIPYWIKLVEWYSKNEIEVNCDHWHYDALCYILARYAKEASVNVIYKEKELTFELRYEVYKLAHEIDDENLRKNIVLPCKEDKPYYMCDKNFICPILDIKIDHKFYLLFTNDNKQYNIKQFRKLGLTRFDRFDMLYSMYCMEENEIIKKQLSLFVSMVLYYSEADSKYLKYFDKYIFAHYKEFEELVIDKIIY